MSYEKNWTDERGFTCWIREIDAAFGKFGYGYTGIRSGRGGGGFTDLLTEAEQAVESAIQGELADMAVREAQAALQPNDWKLLSTFSAWGKAFRHDSQSKSASGERLIEAGYLMRSKPENGGHWYSITESGWHALKEWETGEPSEDDEDDFDEEEHIAPEQRAELERLRARVRELEAKLTPFALAAKNDGDVKASDEDDLLYLALRPGGYSPIQVTGEGGLLGVVHLRDALAAMPQLADADDDRQ